jgi:hypothetical protein
MFSFSVLSIALLLGAAAVTGTGASYISLKSTNTTVKTGDRFSVDVYAVATVPVNAVDVTLHFDKSKMKVEGVDRGQSVLTIWTEDPVISGDSIVLSGGTFRNGFIGEHKIATVRLTALSSGQGDFSVSAITFLAGDGKGTPVKTTSSNSSTLSLFVYNEGVNPDAVTSTIAISSATDLDGDGVVNLKDVSSFMGAWSNSSFLYDFNNDGRMTFVDFSIILADVFKKK